MYVGKGSWHLSANKGIGNSSHEPILIWFPVRVVADSAFFIMVNGSIVVKIVPT